jgi:sphinganine-1-phosphate aldolase
MSQILNKFDDCLKNQKPSTIVIGTGLGCAMAFGLYKIVTYPKSLLRLVFDTMSVLPFVKGKVNEEVAKNLKDVSATIPEVHDPITEKLPQKGSSREEIIARLTHMKKEESDRQKDLTFSGTVYIGQGDHTDMLCEAYKLYVHDNPLHTFTFPSVRKMEAEIISMTKYMLGGNEQTCGAITSGGTESILVSLKAYREWGKRRGITEPEIIVPLTAHAAFWKGADYFGIKLIEVAVNEVDFKLNPKDVEKHINKHTVAIICSAPCYSVGIIDPVEELAELALKHDVGLHVDCCLGGFFLPFAKKDSPIPKFDFSVKGVTTISADTHKYGFATKGTSVVMFSTKELKSCMFFIAPEWTGGIYASPTIAGSRSGAVVATCWASLMSLGEEGYTSINQRIMKEQRIIKKGISDIPEIELMGDPLAMVIA